ncbi:MAG: UDP-glucose 4-epimerase GalE [Deltaproteobacteria bacterium]|nr:UDP-glucose 4-epimerase GalE [Deltaproteobacteria bacterium]
MKILVTGGAGYIGAHVCKALKRRGHVPVVFDNLVYGHREFARWGEFVEGDLADVPAIGAAMKEHRPGAVMHFAAYTYVGESVGNPSKYYHNNVAGSLNLMDCARDAGVRHVVFSSTCATYGVPETSPIAETHPQRPINPYGRTKLVIEGLLDDFDAAYGMRSVKLRYFNAAGADPDAEIGEDHDPETHLIPLVLDAAAGRRTNITIFGEDYDTPDGTCIRDYVHVYDLADAHVLALEYLINGGPGAAFNLGNGLGYSVKEVIDAARRTTGREIPVVMGARRPGDPARLVGSSAKAASTLGWSPRYAGIETIVSHAWKWHTKRFGAGKG